MPKNTSQDIVLFSKIDLLRRISLLSEIVIYLSHKKLFSIYNSPTLNIGFHDPVHTCIKPQNAYNITFETLYNQINAKALEYNYMSNNKIRFSIQEKHQGGEMHFLNNCDKQFVRLLARSLGVIILENRPYKFM